MRAQNFTYWKTVQELPKVHKAIGPKVTWLFCLCVSTKEKHPLTSGIVPYLLYKGRCIKLAERPYKGKLITKLTLQKTAQTRNLKTADRKS